MSANKLSKMIKVCQSYSKPKVGFLGCGVVCIVIIATIQFCKHSAIHSI